MRLYSLGEVCALFAIDPVTLRRWMRWLHISPHIDPSDERRRYLDQAQLFALAEAHCRVCVLPEARTPYTELVQLRQTVQELAQRVARLEARQCVCCSAHVELAAQREGT